VHAALVNPMLALHEITPTIGGSSDNGSWRPHEKRSAMNRAFHVLLLCLILAALADGTQAAPLTFLAFHCDDGTEFVASFYEAGRRAQVQLDGKALTLPRRLALFGPRYSAGGITLRMKGTAATLSRGRRSTECSSG
jgi:membrane-bound inhibitor of C-type lysozyme